MFATSSDDVVGHVVGLDPDASPEIAKREADSIRHVLDFGEVGKAVAGVFPDEALERLQDAPAVEYVEADRKAVEAMAQTLPWGVDRVDADALHSSGETGNGADISILDTGIDSDHADLQGNVAGGKCFAADCCGEASGSYCYTNSNTCNYAWDDDNDHGTVVAGLADALDNTEGVVGVSTEANLYAGKVLDGCGSGSMSDVAAGIEWAADQGHDVASMSLGASSGDSTLKNACEYAYNNGVLLVASAGNDGPCSDCVSYPAAYDEVVAVSATTSDDALADFSSQGPEIELAAPGKDLYTTVAGGYETRSKTSIAAAHVAGAGGQLMAQGYSHTDARQRLRDTAEDVGLAAEKQGSGLLDAELAVLGIFTVSTAQPTNVGEYSATLEGSLDDLGGASSADVYFEYRQTGASSWNTTSVQTLSSTGSFDEDLSNLDHDTEYEYRAVGDASDGDSDVGSTVTFTTNNACVDASRWAYGSGVDGYEYITDVDVDGQWTWSTGDNRYYDQTCPAVVKVQQGGSFTVDVDFEDNGYDNHCGNVYVDWDGDGDWSTNAVETQIFQNVSDDTVTYSATVSVPSDASLGATLARVRLSWNGFYGPTATGEYGEVNDFTIYVE